MARDIFDAIESELARHNFQAAPPSAGEGIFIASTFRPVTGQRHTFAGERGLARVELKMRDIADAVATSAQRQGLGAHTDCDALARDVCVLLEHLLGVPFVGEP